ncbi:MAG TPA: FecR family protein [Terriglobia bacterium]|nr:FecR family protein [Terriglobia bacterium]
MSTFSRKRLGVAGVFCLLAVAAQAAQQPPAAAAPYAGSLVSEWTGKVRLRLPGAAPSAPGRGEKLPAGTTIDTEDGIIVLVLEDESEVLLRPRTQVVLKTPGPGDWNYFQLLWGRIRASVRKRTGGAPPFQMGTPSAVIAVRGTRFDVEVNRRGVTEVDVFQGLVEVGAIGIPGVSVLVQPGFSTRVAPGQAPEPPIRTDEIRPGAMPPQRTMDVEFLREKSMDLGAPAELDELGGELGDDSSQIENESQNARGNHEDQEKDDSKPPLDP